MPLRKENLSINYPQLHRQVWAKEYFRAQANHTKTKFKGDYTQIPRGRVAWTIDRFIVLVGHWAEPIQDELTELLEKEFSLPYFEFVYDEHWDLATLGRATCPPASEAKQTPIKAGHMAHDGSICFRGMEAQNF